MSSTPFSCAVHLYESPTSHASAYEIGPSAASNAILFIGGLGDGPHTVLYTQSLAKHLKSTGQDWSVFEIRMRSSFSGYGYSSLKNDVEDISALVRYLRGIGKKKIVLMGHSTGCQDCAQYTKHKEDPVDGFILQGPVSDRESIADSVDHEWLKNSLEYAEKLIDEGKECEAMPRDQLPSFFQTPMTAYRWHSLAAKGQSFVSEVWNRFQQPVMALQSAEDEFVPDKIDKQALVDSWKKISPKVHELSGLIPGASHTVKKPESQQWLAERVVQFLNQV
ncbi:Esterase lipase [Colletotrichum higginsianum IMI 349063]|uniref:Esterase lipase n=1 Tax=Colletotrichum higginsianum (strain IMI 349063) TaxID=759273 RepID=A0A1B7YPB7_COLHI|nr:Esterase lipase [Colletotrichum higginsianum IMI 349063]OBR13794.1 Esterase lipase [Colletotrichum higginsianum IMI 349063]